jgi:hypothetical protein
MCPPLLPAQSGEVVTEAFLSMQQPSSMSTNPRERAVAGLDLAAERSFLARRTIQRSQAHVALQDRQADSIRTRRVL